MQGGIFTDIFIMRLRVKPAMTCSRFSIKRVKMHSVNSWLSMCIATSLLTARNVAGNNLKKIIPPAGYNITCSCCPGKIKTPDFYPGLLN